MKSSDTACLSVPELRERGWTESLIKRFLKDPDKLVKNPHYSSAAPMRLYLKRRVEKAEGKQTFAEAKAIAAKRSQAGKVASKSADITKREKLLERVRTLQVTVDAMPLKRLLDESRMDWENNPPPSREFELRGGRNADLDTRYRRAVNYARHQLTH
jgi:hypothetical protein